MDYWCFSHYTAYWNVVTNIGQPRPAAVGIPAYPRVECDHGCTLWQQVGGHRVHISSGLWREFHAVLCQFFANTIQSGSQYEPSNKAIFRILKNLGKNPDCVLHDLRTPQRLGLCICYFPCVCQTACACCLTSSLFALARYIHNEGS
jgi:hypothetical protein